MKKFQIAFIIFGSIFSHSYAQDLKAGEINVRHVSGSIYEATVFLYQNISTFINRPSVVLHWGDGAGDTLLSAPYPCGDTSTLVQIFSGTHNFVGAGLYTIWVADSFRVANLQNISNSINEVTLLKYELRVGLPGVYNSSPVFLNCAHDYWECCNWIYNSEAIDSDDDSLSYKLVQPFTTNYTFPPASVDSISGDVIFNPAAIGLYSFCMQIDEWRIISSSYTLIGTTYRQMQIDVYSLTGIDEYDKQNSLTIFPNPFSMETVLYTTRQLKNATLSVENCFGQTVMQIINLNEQSVILSRHNLPNGLYFLRLNEGSRLIAAKKIIIND